MAIHKVGQPLPTQAPNPKPEEVDQQLRDVAKLYEKQFLGEMVKAMRGTVTRSELTEPSLAQKIYEGQMDDQYVETWGDNGGIGLGNIIYDQLNEKFGAAAGQPAPVIDATAKARGIKMYKAGQK